MPIILLFVVVLIIVLAPNKSPEQGRPEPTVTQVWVENPLFTVAEAEDKP